MTILSEFRSSSVVDPETGSVRLLLDRGEYLRAFDLCRRIEADRGHALLEKAKLLARCSSLLGMNDEAVQMLEWASGGVPIADPEYHALLGGFYKRKWLAACGGRAAGAADLLRMSLRSYQESAGCGGGYWSSVNAATLARIDGQTALADRLAGEVIDMCWSEYEQNGTASVFWVPASLGEAFLVRKDYDSAMAWFRTARSHLGGNFGWVASTRSNARLLLEAMGSEGTIVTEVLCSIPSLRVSVFAGHRLDRARSDMPRFPRDATGALKQKLRKAITDLGIDIGIASGADGSDILFHECMMELGRSSTVVLPYPAELFRSRINENAGPVWAERFDAVMDGADRVEIASISRLSSESSALYRFCSDFMLGLSMDVVRQYDAELSPIVVWDGRDAPLGGGTSYLVSRLRELGVKPLRIPPPAGAKRVVASHEEEETSGGGFESPFVSLTGVVTVYEGCISDEEGARVLSDISTALDEIGRYESLRIDQSCLMPGMICFTASPPQDMGRFLATCCERMSGLQMESMVVHAGLALRTSRSGRSAGCYCRELEEAAAAAGSGTIPKGFFCSLQVKSFLSIRGCEELRLEYRGVFATDQGRGLRLFQIHPSGSNL